jgi:hypothetical protein
VASLPSEQTAHSWTSVATLDDLVIFESRGTTILVTTHFCMAVVRSQNPLRSSSLLFRLTMGITTADHEVLLLWQHNAPLDSNSATQYDVSDMLWHKRMRMRIACSSGVGTQTAHLRSSYTEHRQWPNMTISLQYPPYSFPKAYAQPSTPFPYPHRSQQAASR